MEELSSEDEEVFVVAALLCEEDDDKNAESKRKFWVHPINKKRRLLGEFHHLFPDLERDHCKFFQYFRMSRMKFQELLDIICPALTFQNTTFRRAVSPEERLAVCLRYVFIPQVFNFSFVPFLRLEK